jgi:hypothetical protein
MLQDTEKQAVQISWVECKLEDRLTIEMTCVRKWTKGTSRVSEEMRVSMHEVR